MNTCFGIAGDPFGGFLDHLDGSLIDSALPTVASFSEQDVHNLVGVVTNDCLEPGIRKSATDQLGVIARNLDLLDALAQPKLLTALLSEAYNG